MADQSKRATPWRVEGKWSVSPYGYDPEVRKDWTLPKQITVHDVTLRDGEQTPGVVFRKDEKLKIAHALEEAGVQRIEGGMVSVSPEDFDAIATMVKEIKNSEISSFIRARKDDLELAMKAGVKRVIMEITAIDTIIKGIWGSRQKAVEDITKLTQTAKKNGLNVTFFLMESARAPIDMIQELIVPVVNEGKADNIAIVDTRGSAYPPGFAWLIKKVRTMVKVPIEIHCHNNWGVATATTLAGITTGAEIVHTCINGMGGNAPLDEIILGAEAFLGVKTGVKTEGFRKLSKMTREFSNANWYKPFVGELAEQVEVGIATRQMWDRKEEKGYGRGELLNYEIVGGKAIDVVLGKKSGRYSILLKSWEKGWPLPSEEQASQMLTQIKKIAEENKRWLTEEEFKKIYSSTMGEKK
jgi:isopropylmalate/homocitrate/citramalate synthase